jgi:hypothetical protein
LIFLNKIEGDDEMKVVMKRPELLAIIIAIILGSLWYISFSETSLQFTRELVEVKLNDINNNFASVVGIYEFYNDGVRKINFPIGFPFIVDKDCEFPPEIKIEYAPIENSPESVSEYGEMSLDLTSLEYKRKGKIVVFALPVEPKKKVVVKISYKQKVHTNNYTYITTTALLWNKPIKEAIFKIEYPESIKNVKSNYTKTGESKMNDKFFIYTYQLFEFVPNEDFKIQWEKD